MANRHIKESHKTGKLHLLAGKLLFLAPWLIIWSYLMGTNQYGLGEGVQPYMYWLAGSTFILSLGYIIIERGRHKNKSFASEYGNVEWTYMIVSLLLKAAFAAQVYSALLKK